MSAGLLSFLLLLVVPLVWLALAYNRLVSLRNALRNAFAQIDVQLKRRHDLVPGLVEVAQAYLVHERRTLEAVVAAPAVLDVLREGLRRLHAATGGAGSMHARRALLLDEPPSIDAGEITDKGYLNQRAVLARRAAQVARLYAAVPDERVVTL